MQVDRALANALDAQLAAATACDEVKEEVKEELEEGEVAADEEAPLGLAEVEVGDRDEADAAFGEIADDEVEIEGEGEGWDGEAQFHAQEAAAGSGDGPQLAGPTHTYTSMG